MVSHIQAVAEVGRDVARRVPTPMPIVRSANGAKPQRVVREGYPTFYIFLKNM